MSGGGGGSGNGGGGDMQVSGAEAAYSKEKGISTAADTRVSQTSFSPGGGGDGQIDYADSGGNLQTADIGTGPGQVDPGLAKGVLGADTSMVGKSAPDTDYSVSEIEKGYTDEGVKLDQVGAGIYMTKKQQYNTGLIQKDPTTGEDIQGSRRINPNTGELERTDLSFGEHWANRPDALKYSPTLSLLYAGGKNIGEFFKNKGFQGYNEAGLRTSQQYQGVDGRDGGDFRSGGNGMTERERMNIVAPHASYIVAGTTKPSDSPALTWYQNLGKTSTNPAGFDLATEYAAAKVKVSNTLKNSGSVGQMAVSESPFFNFLKDNSLDKGIL